MRNHLFLALLLARAYPSVAAVCQGSIAPQTLPPMLPTESRQVEYVTYVGSPVRFLASHRNGTHVYGRSGASWAISTVLHGVFGPYEQGVNGLVVAGSGTTSPSVWAAPEGGSNVSLVYEFSGSQTILAAVRTPTANLDVIVTSSQVLWIMFDGTLLASSPIVWDSSCDSLRDATVDSMATVYAFCRQPNTASLYVIKYNVTSSGKIGKVSTSIVVTGASSLSYYSNVYSFISNEVNDLPVALVQFDNSSGAALIAFEFGGSAVAKQAPGLQALELRGFNAVSGTTIFQANSTWASCPYQVSIRTRINASFWERQDFTITSDCSPLYIHTTSNMFGFLAYSYYKAYALYRVSEKSSWTLTTMNTASYSLYTECYITSRCIYDWEDGLWVAGSRNASNPNITLYQTTWCEECISSCYLNSICVPPGKCSCLLGYHGNPSEEPCTYCGDGKAYAGEECDEGVGCNSNCTCAVGYHSENSSSCSLNSVASSSSGNSGASHNILSSNTGDPTASVGERSISASGSAENSFSQTSSLISSSPDFPVAAAHSSISIAAVTGGVLGGVALLALSGAGIVVVLRTKGKRERYQETHSSPFSSPCLSPRRVGALELDPRSAVVTSSDVCTSTVCAGMRISTPFKEGDEPRHIALCYGKQMSVQILELGGKELREFKRVFPAHFQMHHEDYNQKRINAKLSPLTFIVPRVWEVKNPLLEEWYALRLAYMRDVLCRNPEMEELDERTAFHGTDDANIEKICLNGLLRIGHPLNPSQMTDAGFFGDPHYGVYASRFVEYALQYSNMALAVSGDRIPVPLDEGKSVRVIMFKCLPGKTLHMEKLAAAVKPTVGYDSHSSPSWLEWYFFDETQLCPTHIVEVKAIANTRTAANDGLVSNAISVV